MIWLIAASLIWAFSFGLIKGMTTGIDPLILGYLRSLTALFVFLPFGIRGWLASKRRGEPWARTWTLAFFAGVIQLGLMYPPYLSAFKYLKAHEVALYTMTTPLLSSALSSRHRGASIPKLIGPSILAVIGGSICAWKGTPVQQSLYGIALVQVANLMFAAGSLVWRRIDGDLESSPRPGHASTFMFPYFVGAALTSGLVTMWAEGSVLSITPTQWLVILWLGAVASGVGFFLWNYGVTKVSVTRLAVANNLKLPLAIVVSLAVFSESANLVTLISGGLLITLALFWADAPPKAK